MTLEQRQLVSPSACTVTRRPPLHAFRAMHPAHVAQTLVPPRRGQAHPELMDLLSSVGADSPPVVRPRAGAPGSAPSPVMMHKNQSFTMVLPEELDPGSPVSTAGGETGASAAPDLSAPGPSARRDGGAGASSRRDEPGGRPESNGEASVSGQHRPGEEPPWWARVAQEIAEHTMGAVGHAQRMLAGQGDRERSGSSEAAGASSGAEGTAGGKPADRRPDAPGDAAAATTSAAAGANGGGGANKPEQQQRGEGQSGDPLLDFQKWAAEQAAGAQHAVRLGCGDSTPPSAPSLQSIACL